MSLKPATKAKSVKDITQEQAFAEAVRRWPNHAIIKKSLDGTCTVGVSTGKDEEMIVYGKAKTWREAFAQADAKTQKA